MTAPGVGSKALSPLAADELASLRALSAAGMPLFASRANRDYELQLRFAKDPNDVPEFHYPNGWQRTEADPWAVESWAEKRPDGIHLLCRKLCVLDIDSAIGHKKWVGDPEGVLELLLTDGVEPLAIAGTPGGGLHVYVGAGHRSTNHGGIDLQGTGKFVHLPGTRRPKHNGGGYGWRQPPTGLARLEDPAWVAQQAAALDRFWVAWAGGNTSFADGPTQPVAAEKLDQTKVSARLAELLEDLGPEFSHPDGTMDRDRSARFFRIVAEARRAGLSQGETVSAVTPWCQAVGKYADRVAAEVARVWPKVFDPVDEWLADSQPASTGTPAGGDESRDQDGSDSAAEPFVWPQVIPITEGSSVAFPVDALPEGMAAAVAEVAEAVIVDPAIPATAFLGAATGAIGALTEVVITPTWRRWCNNYFVVVAPTGVGKTPGTTPAIEPLHVLEEDLRRKAEEERRVAKVLAPVLRRQLDTMQKTDAPNVRDMADLQGQLDDAETKLRRDARMLVDDVTPERLAELLADNDGRLTAVNDEGSLFRHLLGLYTNGGTPNLDPFLKAWDGSRLTVDRKGGGGREKTALNVPRALLTMVAAVQPTTIREIGSKQHRDLVERGVVGRVLIAWPQSTAGTRMLSGRSMDRYRHVDPWNGQVLREARRGIQVIPFTDPAREAFLRWHDHVEGRLPLGRALADVREFAVKIRDSVARIAGLFARLDGAATVEPEHVQRAISLGDYYLAHSQAVVEAWASGSTEIARKLIARAAELPPGPSGLVSFTVNDAYRRLVRVPAAAMIDALELLDAHGYVRPGDPHIGYGTAGKGIGKRSPLVLFNPQAHTASTPEAHRNPWESTESTPRKVV